MASRIYILTEDYPKWEEKDEAITLRAFLPSLLQGMN